MHASLYLLKVKPNDVSRSCFECRSLLQLCDLFSLYGSVAARLNCAGGVPAEAWLRWGSWHVMASGPTPVASRKSRWCRPDRKSSPAWCLRWTQWYVLDQDSHSVVSFILVCGPISDSPLLNINSTLCFCPHTSSHTHLVCLSCSAWRCPSWMLRWHASPYTRTAWSPSAQKRAECSSTPGGKSRQTSTSSAVSSALWGNVDHSP